MLDREISAIDKRCRYDFFFIPKDERPKIEQQRSLFANIEQIKNETDANDELIDRLKVLSKSNKDDASAELERQQIIEN